MLLEIAGETGLDVAAFTRALEGTAARAAVLAEAREGRERFRVRGTPTVMLADGTKLRLPIAYPVIHEHRVVGVGKLTCVGEECLAQTRALFERALSTPPPA